MTIDLKHGLINKTLLDNKAVDSFSGFFFSKKAPAQTTQLI